jgi:hypothetical protein
MNVFGTVKNGMVVLDEGTSLPDGTRVEVVARAESAEPPTFLDLLDLAGLAKDLPPDFAAQHDHYIHGTPKR